MPCLSSGWKHAKDRTHTRDAGFARHLRDLARPTQIAYARIMGRHGGDPSGIEYRHRERQAWAFVLPDMSGNAAWRIQFFDAFAFSSHQCYSTLEEAVEEMVRQGYEIEDAGALDRASVAEAWAQGLRWLEEVRAHNTAAAA